MSDEAFIDDDILHYQRRNIVNYIAYINRHITTLCTDGRCVLQLTYIFYTLFYLSTFKRFYSRFLSVSIHEVIIIHQWWLTSAECIMKNGYWLKQAQCSPNINILLSTDHFSTERPCVDNFSVSFKHHHPSDSYVQYLAFIKQTIRYK